MDTAPHIAVIIPCYNEEKTIAAVVKSFRRELPHAAIHVFDNNSTDRTVKEAEAAGAVVGFERRQGKGNVVRAMLRAIDADIYVMVDGDGTYPADRVHELIAPVVAGEADMTIGSRLQGQTTGAFRILNLFGNRLFLRVFNAVFRVQITDLLSGYRAFTKAAAKSLPLLSRGFEIETELTAKCIEHEYRIREIPVNLSSRPEGSRSKIKVVRDGILIMRTIFSLFRDYKPLTAFGLAGTILITLGLIPGFVVIREFLLTHYIQRVPSAILAVGLVLAGLFFIFTGIILHTIARRFQELNSQLQTITETLIKKQ